MHHLASLEGAARRVETPCDAGHMVWRIWNESAGSPLLLLHGGNGSWRHWVRNIGHFAATRCVIAPDLPGLGESALPPDPQEPASVARVVAEGLPAVVGATRAVDLVGFSFGANVAGQAAAMLGDGLRSLTIVGAGSLGLERAVTPLIKIRDKHGAARIAAHRANLAALMIANAEHIDAQALAIQEWNTVHARFRSRGFAEAGGLKDALAKVVVPVAALWGARDQVALPTLPARLATVRSVQPSARTALIPDAGHWVAYEAPEAFNAQLAAWLGADR
jgi:pimeloyl-ACP methyl ester carboxylesterase